MIVTFLIFLFFLYVEITYGKIKSRDVSSKKIFFPILFCLYDVSLQPIGDGVWIDAGKVFYL